MCVCYDIVKVYLDDGTVIHEVSMFLIQFDVSTYLIHPNFARNMLKPT